MTLAAGSSTTLEIDASVQSNDVLAVTGRLTYGGTLVVENLGGTFALGDSFTLFEAGTFVGEFSNLDLPELESGLDWNTSALSNGILSVCATLSNEPVAVELVMTNSQLHLFWPADHIGWRAEYNVDSLTNDAAWTSIDASESTNWLNVNFLEESCRKMFFRLVYP